MKRIVVFLLSLMLILSFSLVQGQAAGPALQVDANAAQHPISPNIYGMNFADPDLAEAVRLPINRWGGSQFLDSAATGRYQSYLADEIVPFVEARYRTFAERAGRAVLGRSSGGFGALRLGLDRPEVFGAIGSHAGDSAFEISVLPELRDAAIAYDRSGGLSGFLARFEETPARVSFTGLVSVLFFSYSAICSSEI